jgi:dephospho-CoA kinase
MTHHENLKILAFVGLTGSGKTTAVEHFTKKGFPKVYFGGVIYKAMAEAGIERTADSERIFREKYREEHGKDVVANKIVEQIRELAAAGQHRVIADGIYTWSEYKVMKHAFPGELNVVAIVSPRRTRYHRLANRVERSYTETEAYERDQSEIENLEKGGPIAIADHYIINDDSEEALYEKLESLASELEFTN